MAAGIHFSEYIFMETNEAPSILTFKMKMTVCKQDHFYLLFKKKKINPVLFWKALTRAR